LLPAFVGHVIVPHESEPEPHVTSHLHDCVHATLAHANTAEPEPEPEPLPEPSPVHVTSHAPRPHATAPHAPSPVHVTVQAVAPLHVTCGQAPAAVHAIWQFQPVGQVMPAPVPCIMHVPDGKSHDAHSGGHTAASIGGASGVPTTQ
jgi:hypothetical protein